MATPEQVGFKIAVQMEDGGSIQKLNIQAKGVKSTFEDSVTAAKLLNSEISKFSTMKMVGGAPTQVLSKENIPKLQEALISKGFSSVKSNTADIAFESKAATESIRGFGATGVKSIDNLNQGFNGLRWSVVNFGFALSALGASFAPFVLLTKYGMDLETIFTRISIVTGQSVDKISSSLQQLRRGTVFSLEETATAFLEFTKAGFSAEQAVAVIPSVIRLSQVGFTDLTTAVKLTAQVLHQFNLDATEASDVAKTLAAGANLSATDVEGFGTALSYVGPIAEQLGITMQETSAAIALLSNSGQGASKAGTTLSAALIKLIEPGEEAKKKLKSLGAVLFDSRGEFLGIDNAIKQLSASVSGLSTEDKLKNLTDIFGRIGGRAIMSLMSQYTESGMSVAEMEKDIANSTDLATSAMKIQATAAAELKKAYEDLKVALVPVSSTFTSWTAGTLREVTGRIEILVGAFKAFKDIINGSTKPFEELNRNFNAADAVVSVLISSLPILGTVVYNVLKLFGLTDGIDNAASSLRRYGNDGEEAGRKVETLTEKEEKAAKVRKAAWEDSILAVVTNYTGALSDLTTIIDKFTKDSANKFDENFSGIGGELLTIATRFKEQAKASTVADAIMEVVNSIDLNSLAYDGLNKELDAFNINLKEEQNNLSNLNDDLDVQQKTLKKYKDELTSVNDIISKLSNARFVGQTGVEQLISKVDIWQKKQKLATYGIGDAFAFLQSAVKMTESEYENFFRTIVKTNEATKDSKTDYDAWRETVRTFIEESISIGNDLGKSVTGAVGKYKTLLLSTSKFSDSTDSSSEAVGLLQDAYDVHYGAMEEDVRFAIQAHEDQTNGVYSSSGVIISALQAQWVSQIRLTSAISATEDEISILKDSIDITEKSIKSIKRSIDTTTSSMDDLITSTKEAISQLKKLEKLDKPYEKTWEGGGMSIAPPSAQTDQYMTPYTPEQYMTPNVPTQYMTPNIPPAPESNFWGTLDNIGEILTSSLSNSFSGLFGFNDFIMRPGQEPVKFSADDTLVGTKGGMGGGGVNIGNITISGVSGNAEDFAYAFAQELRRQIRAV